MKIAGDNSVPIDNKIRQPLKNRLEKLIRKKYQKSNLLA